MVVWLCTGFCVVFDFWWVFSDFFQFSVTPLQSLIIGIGKVCFTECIEVIWMCLMAGYQIRCFGGGFVAFTEFYCWSFFFNWRHVYNKFWKQQQSCKIHQKQSVSQHLCHSCIMTSAVRDSSVSHNQKTKLHHAQQKAEAESTYIYLSNEYTIRHWSDDNKVNAWHCSKDLSISR